MPSIPRKQPLAEFLARKGFWVMYPPLPRGVGKRRQISGKIAHQDVLDILDELPQELEEIAFGRRFRLAPDQVFVIGGSFGGAAAILLSLDPRIRRVVANCPVVDWKILDRSEKMETLKENYVEYIHDAFGNGYRISETNWRKLRSGIFYNPWHHRREITPTKVLMFHAKDDPFVPYECTRKFAEVEESH